MMTIEEIRQAKLEAEVRIQQELEQLQMKPECPWPMCAFGSWNSPAWRPARGRSEPRC